MRILETKPTDPLYVINEEVYSVDLGLLETAKHGVYHVSLSP